MENAPSELASLKQNMGAFIEETPDVQQFVGYVETAEKTAALDAKTKELMSLAIGVVLRCEPCILWHMDAALEAGATPDEVYDALNVAVVMGGGPALAYATKAHEILVEFAE